MITRRKLLTTIGLYAIAAPLASFAQQTGQIFRIGFIWPGSASVGRADIDVIKQRLRELGHAEGRDFSAEYRWAEGKAEMFPRFAAELVRLKVDVIVTRSTPAALAAKATTREIPIVFSMVSDPVASGVVDHLSRPGGNITGWSNILPETSGKLLELLKMAVPRMSRVAVLADPDNPGKVLEVMELKKVTDRMGLTLQSLEVRTAKDVDDAFSKMVQTHANALIVLSDGVTATHRQRIVDFAAKSRLPAIYQVREFSDAGGLMSYGPNMVRQHRLTADYLHRIFKGAKPRDLPVEQPTKFELLINRKTAKALALVLPQELLLRADEVIE